MFDFACKLFGSKRLKDKLKEIKRIEHDFLCSQQRIMYLVDKMIEKQNLIDAIFEGIPDWIWHKDLNGVYVQVNEKIRQELFAGLPYNQIIGFNDVQIADRLKSIYGDTNHTFGALCFGSDQPVLESAKPMKFNEWGKVKGKELRVIVHKNVVRDATGKIVGTTGTGYNITEDYNLLSKIIDDTKDCPCGASEQLREFNDKDIFTLDKSHVCKDC